MGGDVEIREDLWVTTLDHCQVSVTCRSRDEATTIADALVEQSGERRDRRETWEKAR
jgi:hypothetical protein